MFDPSVLSSDDFRVPTARTYRFSITVNVEPGQAGYDDPEWIADAAWGALTNEYGYDCAVDSIEEIGEGTAMPP